MEVKTSRKIFQRHGSSRGMSQGLQDRYNLILYSYMSEDNDAATASKGYIGIEKKPLDFSRGFCYLFFSFFFFFSFSE